MERKEIAEKIQKRIDTYVERWQEANKTNGSLTHFASSTGVSVYTDTDGNIIVSVYNGCEVEWIRQITWKRDNLKVIEEVEENGCVNFATEIEGILFSMGFEIISQKDMDID